MDKDTLELFAQVIANQLVIYKKLDGIEKEIKGVNGSKPELYTYIDNLKSEAEEFRDFIRNGI